MAVKARTLLSAVTITLLATACAEQPQSVTGPGEAPAPLLSVGGDQFQDRYIVVFNPGTPGARNLANDLVQTHGGTIHFTYETALQGFAATLPSASLEGIRRNPNVSFIEADGEMIAIGDQGSPPSWGLDRIDQTDLPLSQSYHYDNDGSGVSAYIIDTGIRFDHQEYNGRAFSGYDFVDGDSDAADCHGHGTHVAGTVGGTTVGVAKNVSLYAVRVLGCSGSGSYAGVIAGIDWVAANGNHPAVANMSLGGGFSSAVNTAVNNAVASGVTFAVAAGNENTDACIKSPASAANALTVGASTSTDVRSSFSNYGTCVDLFAPGSSIYSSTQTTTSSYASWSGTSMATPHVAGVAALFLAAHPTADAGTVEAAVVGGASLGRLSSIGNGSPNLLLYSLITSGTPPPPPPPPPPSADVPTHVADVLAISETSGKKNWKATLFVKAHELNGATHTELDGATVHVSWSGGATGETTCLTVTGGTCYIQTGQIPNSQASITFKITNISLSGYVYQKSDNHDDPSDGSVLLNDDEVAASKPGGGSGGNPGKGKKPN
jgi:subtilisin family serine protease